MLAVNLYLGDEARNLDPQHSERMGAWVWANGARIEVLLYSEPQPGEDPSDRIHLLVTDQGGERRGWLMNQEDALAVMTLLEMAACRAAARGYPFNATA